jgi:hypothetical protein
MDGKSVNALSFAKKGGIFHKYLSLLLLLLFNNANGN